MFNRERRASMLAILDLQKLATLLPPEEEGQSTSSIFCGGGNLGLSTCSNNCGGG